MVKSIIKGKHSIVKKIAVSDIIRDKESYIHMGGTMNNAKIAGREYEFSKNIFESESMVDSFIKLAIKNFGIDFSRWIEFGYNSERYIPYVLVNCEGVIANVSVNIMNFMLDGKEKNYIQIGTVMTDESYRGLGLSRFLIKRVLNDWEDKVDGVYLFANDSVLDFYPRFEFVKIQECQFFFSVKDRDEVRKLRKIDMDIEEERKFVYGILEEARCNYRFQMKDNAMLVMFYLIGPYKDNVYYSKEYDAIIIYDINGNCINLLDIYSREEIKTKEMIDLLPISGIEQINFGFTPIDVSILEKKKHKEVDTTLFVLGGLIKDSYTNSFDKNFIFPKLSHA